MNEYVFFIVVSVFLLFNILLAFVRNRKEKNTFIKFIADPNKYGTVIIALSISGTIVGGGMFMTVGQIGYESVSASIILGFVYFAGLFLAGITSRKIRDKMDNENHSTLIDFLKSHYNEKTVILFSVINIFMYLFLLAGQFVAVFQLLYFTSGFIVNKWIPVVLTVLAFISILLIPVIGGLRKDIQTDILQMGVIFLASIIICYKFFQTNNLLYMVQNVRQVETDNYGWTFIAGSILFITPSFFVRMDIWQRIRSAKTNNASFGGFIVAGLISLFFFGIFTIMGIWANSTGIKESQFSILELIFSIFKNPVTSGFIIGALFAAVLSTADTLINATSIFVTRLCFTEKWKHKTDNAISSELLCKSRLIGLVIFVISLILGYIIPNIVDLMVGAISLLLIFLPTILGLFIERWKNVKATYYASITGLVVFVLFFVFGNPKVAFIPAVVMTCLAYFIIRLLNRLNILK
jgi:SSS family solute:Na+ symporter